MKRVEEFLRDMDDDTLSAAFDEALELSRHRLTRSPTHGYVRMVVNALKRDIGNDVGDEVRSARLAIMTEIALRWIKNRNTADSADERAAAKEAGRTGQLPATGDGGMISGERRSGKDTDNSSAPILQAEHSGSIPETRLPEQSVTPRRKESVLVQQPSSVGTQPDSAVFFSHADAQLILRWLNRPYLNTYGHKNSRGVQYVPAGFGMAGHLWFWVSTSDGTSSGGGLEQRGFVTVPVVDGIPVLDEKVRKLLSEDQ